jgi:glucan endo-1,6-beta-glucosidase
MRTLIFLTALVATAHAWLPSARNMTNHEGNSLFESRDSASTTSSSSSSGAPSRRWLPGTLPVRGVNLGSMFVVEPWMASNEWANVLQCGSTGSEFDCVNMLGQATANANWAKHWSSWITESDLDTMVSYSLNTIRIPVGYWIWEALKYDRYAGLLLTYYGRI